MSDTPPNGKLPGGSVPAWFGAFTALLTAVYSAGYQGAEVKNAAAANDRQDRALEALERENRYLASQLRRLQSWPARSSSPSTKTDDQ